MPSSNQITPKQMSALSAGGSPVQKCPASSWVRIELLDEDDEPVAGAAFRVETSDGEVHEGTTGADGGATLSGLKPGGPVTVTFPDYDQSYWTKA
jgi:hypothetical protein